MPPASPVVTHAGVLRIAVPMTLANVTTPMLGVVGTAVIGQLGEAHLLGAIAIAGVVFDCIFWLFSFLRMGTVALTAQALGARDAVEQQTVLARALVLAAAIGAVLIAAQAPLSAAAFDLIGASDEVTEAARLYFHVRIWSAPFTLANYAVLGWLLGLGRANVALALQIVINVLNVVLTALLVLRLDRGVAGAASATVSAEIVGLVVGLGIIWHILADTPRPALARVLDRALLVRMLVVNRDIMIRTAALLAAFGFFAAQGARGGDILLAANSVLHNFVLVGAFFLDGFASAAEQLCGRALGARDPKGFSRAVRLCFVWSSGFGVAMALACVAAGPELTGLMTTSLEVQAAAQAYLPYAAAVSAVGVFAYTYDGIYIGATWTRDMRNLMLAALAIYLAAWWATASLGNAGLWLALIAFMAARGALQAARYPALVRRAFKTEAFTPAIPAP